MKYILFLLLISFGIKTIAQPIDSLEIDEMPEEVADQIFTIVENPAQFSGGMIEFYRFIGENIIYPEQARRMQVQGTVYVQFIVDIDGAVTEVFAVKGIGAGCDEEAVKVIQSSPKWNPAMQRGVFVKQRLLIPIKFGFGEESIPFERQSLLEVQPYQRDPSFIPPYFPGGSEKLESYIRKVKKEPLSGIPPNREKNSVKLEFIVDSLGNIPEVIVVSSLTDEHNQEATRIFRNMPKWVPAKFNNNNVSSVWHWRVYFGNISPARWNRGNELYQKAVKMYAKEKRIKAIEFFSKAIELNPTVLDYYFDRSVTYIQMDQIENGCNDLILIKERDEQAKLLFDNYCN